ncbi:DNA ligase 1-like [Neocloeon triangulifer]|uniref:DNA ligase 1-like n=1 Tax=Neocloeon triangulifer TaxID=2078957 RepID=UPI00286F30BC|nr:DNA ligase 1-like [Neocloeon triangulifer]
MAKKGKVDEVDSSDEEISSDVEESAESMDEETDSGGESDSNDASVEAETKPKKSKEKEKINARTLTDQQLIVEISKLKKIAKVCKIHIIQSLIRKARKLQSQVDKDPKNKERADLQLESMEAIKRLGVEDAVKFAITNDLKTCQTVLSSSTSNTKQKAMARVAIEAKLRQYITEIAAKYDGWDEAASKFCPEAKVTKKRKFRKRKPKADKRTKKPKSKRAESSKKEKAVKSVEKKVDEPDEKKEDIIDLKHSNKIPSSTKIEKDIKEAKPKTPKQKLVEEAVEIKSPLLKFCKKSPVQPKVATAVVKKLETLQDLEQLFHGTVAEENGVENKGKKDSFFLSSDGLEVSSDEEVQKDESESSEEEYNDKSYQSRTYHARNKELNERTRSSFGDLHSNAKKGQKSPKPRDSGKGFKNGKLGIERRNKSGDYQEKQRPPSQEAEKLHPSWEAKRKQSAIQISTTPTNKKIKFD